jgi:peroxiredoxin
MNALSRLAVFVLSATALLAFMLSASPSMAALKAGDQAPDFSASAFLAGEPFTFRLADALEKGPVVVYFFPAAHTPGCNLEASLFSQAIERFKAHGATVIGVTAGNIDTLADFSKDTGLCAGKFPVAADPGAAIAGRYEAVMDRKPELSNRTSYVISRDGEIVRAYSDSNPNRHVAETLAAVQSLDRR